MSNTQACIDEMTNWVETNLYSGLADATDHIEEGRFPKTSRPTPYFFVQTLQEPRATLLAGGGRIRTYEFKVMFSRRRGDVQEGTTLEKTLRADEEAFRDAFDGATYNDFALSGLRIVRATLLSRDSAAARPRAKEEQSSYTKVAWEFREL